MAFVGFFYSALSASCLGAAVFELSHSPLDLDHRGAGSVLVVCFVLNFFMAMKYD